MSLRGESASRSRDAVLERSRALGLVCKVHESEGGGTEEVESAIYEQSLLAPELRQARRKWVIEESDLRSTHGACCDLG